MYSWTLEIESKFIGLVRGVGLERAARELRIPPRVALGRAARLKLRDPEGQLITTSWQGCRRKAVYRG